MSKSLTGYQKWILNKILFEHCFLYISKQKNGTYKHWVADRHEHTYQVIRSDASKKIRSYFASRIKSK